MKKWIIHWDCGFGLDHEIVEVETLQEASEWAYENWRDDAESQAIYGAEEYTQEEAIALGLESEPDDA